MDLLSLLTKVHSTAASDSRKKRMPRGGRKHARRGIRQLQVTSNNETLSSNKSDPLVALQTSFDGLKIPDYSGVLDTMWLLVCGTFVFFMHAGFAMLEAGSGRAKNVQAILIKNLLTVCMGTLGWYILGWSLAYGGNTRSANWEDGTFEECSDVEDQ